jgi:hypothetical protein
LLHSLTLLSRRIALAGAGNVKKKRETLHAAGSTPHSGEGRDFSREAAKDAKKIQVRAASRLRVFA